MFTGWSEPREAPPQARDGLLEASLRRAGLRSTRAEPVETPAWGSPGGGKGRRPEMGRRGRTGHGGLAEGEAEAGSPGGGGSSGRAPADRCHLSGTRQEGKATSLNTFLVWAFDLHCLSEDSSGSPRKQPPSEVLGDKSVFILAISWLPETPELGHLLLPTCHKPGTPILPTPAAPDHTQGRQDPTPGSCKVSASTCPTPHPMISIPLGIPW